ncbi:hypothetical protein [Rubinisphaera italica]|uniref:Collagen triple helix repeat (20 copies) n=1 Tax=Rubinisphaera italica TaxID=2527969 RepID=A0A5C5XL66_9PLAN|nr:hypothetical protein [Rubinisphaera italica]TWT63181.1 hypothetical protein Pan54_39340 [Rubinisphaera italica]
MRHALVSAVALLMILVTASQLSAQDSQTAQRPPNCAVPKSYVPPQSQQPPAQVMVVNPSEWHGLRVDVLRLDSELSHLKKAIASGSLQGPAGPPGPAGSPGPAGRDGVTPNLIPYQQKIREIESRLLAIKPRTGQSQATPATRQTSAQKPSQHWLTEILQPVARVVGTVYAGPLVGAIAAGGIGWVGWFFGRKKGTETYVPRPVPGRPQGPSYGEQIQDAYRGVVVQRDGSTTGYPEEPQKKSW